MDIQAITELLIATWKNCYRDFMPLDFLESLSLDRQIERHTNYMLGDTYYFIAENENNELVGFSSYGESRMKSIACDHELYTLYVNPIYQREGIGHLLLNSVLKKLKNKEEAIAVSVFQKNPFKRFYIKNDFLKIEEEIIDLGSFELIGEIYLWTEPFNPIPALELRHEG